MGLRDRIVVVSGAAGGMGRAIVEMLIEEGATMALADLSADGLGELEAHAQERGVQVMAQATDVTDEEQVAAFFGAVKAQFGRADVLVNLPGLSKVAQISEMDLADYRRIIDVNLMGTFLCAKHFIPLVDVERGGQIINTASMASKRANPNAPVYCAAKAAVAMLSQGLALQLKERNIRVSTLNPGPTDTQGFWGDRPVPRDKFLRPGDVAQVIRFILSQPPHVLVHEVSFESFEFFK